MQSSAVCLSHAIMTWTFGLQLLQDVGHLRPLSRGLDGFEVSLLAEGLAARGWEVQVCCQGHRCAQCKTGWSGPACLDNLHHQYIHCSRSPDGEVRRHCAVSCELQVPSRGLSSLMCARRSAISITTFICVAFETCSSLRLLCACVTGAPCMRQHLDVIYILRCNCWEQ